MSAEHAKPAWYVLYAYPGHEAKLTDNLRNRLGEAGLLDHVYDLLIPQREPAVLELTKTSHGKTVYPNLFPGAVFVLASMTRQVWDVIRQTPGLTGFYGTGNQPLAYPPVDRSVQQRTGVSPAQADQPGPKGRLVRIVNGPFRDFRGLVFDVDEQHARLRVMIDFHQRPTSLDLGIEEVDQG